MATRLTRLPTLMPLQYSSQFRTAILFSCLWPTLSYLALWGWRFGIGGIAFKLVPLVLMQAWCTGHAHRPPLGAMSLLRQTVHVQLWLVIALEMACLALLRLTPDGQGLVVTGVLAGVTWAMHTVIGGRSLYALWRQGCFRAGSSS